MLLRYKMRGILAPLNIVSTKICAKIVLFYVNTNFKKIFMMFMPKKTVFTI